MPGFIWFVRQIPEAVRITYVMRYSIIIRVTTEFIIKRVSTGPWIIQELQMREHKGYSEFLTCSKLQVPADSLSVLAQDPRTRVGAIFSRN